ncbi:MAG: hypothetical protein HRT61_13055 [Ekhidna sp.]|nr:hypothetical protein [Ekhidna sp.]
MLFLPRQIRRKILRKNQITTYLLYAIGEIVLVVVGILIAVSIDDSNQVRKDRQKEESYLKEYKRDLEVNIAELDRVTKRATYTSQVCDSLMGHIIQDTLELSDEAISILILESVYYTVFTAHESTIRDLLSSGNLELIGNDSIRKAIGSWDAELKYLREFELGSKENGLELNDYLVAELNIWKPMNKVYDNSFRPSIERRYFLNLLADRRLLTRGLSELYGVKKKKLETLLSKVETYIED